MMRITCPNCGARNSSEFRFGGEYNPRPKNPLECEETLWNDYVYMRRNKRGVQKEWWYHRDGCGQWFLADRHTQTNEVMKTYLWQPRGAREEE